MVWDLVAAAASTRGGVAAVARVLYIRAIEACLPWLLALIKPGFGQKVRRTCHAPAA